MGIAQLKAKVLTNCNYGSTRPPGVFNTLKKVLMASAVGKGDKIRTECGKQKLRKIILTVYSVSFILAKLGFFSSCYKCLVVFLHKIVVYGTITAC